MIKIKALDSFYDQRTGMMHKGQEIEVSEPTAAELEKFGHVEIVSEKSKTETKKQSDPENKMMGQTKNKTKKGKKPND